MYAKKPIDDGAESLDAASKRLLSSAFTINRQSPWDASALGHAQGAAHLSPKYWWQHSYGRPVDYLLDSVVRATGGSSSTPSLRALRETIEYFSGLYQDRLPDLGIFSRLLRRNGTPDWPNPFPEGTEEHYLLHPQGFLAADLSVVLDGLTQDWNGVESHYPPRPKYKRAGSVAAIELNQANHDQANHDQTNHDQTNHDQTNHDQANHDQANHDQAGNKAHVEGQSLDAGASFAKSAGIAEPGSVEAAIQANIKTDIQDKAAARDAARGQWLTLLMKAGRPSRICGFVHPDNLFLATHDAALNAQRLGLPWTIQEISKQAKLWGWGSAKSWEQGVITKPPLPSHF
jgi:hypothetical protein